MDREKTEDTSSKKAIPYDRITGALLGLAIGDALGTTLEFSVRDSRPIHTEMTGGGPFNLEPGKWTDDTSMALCIATSLLETGTFDAIDQLEKYLKWWKKGYLSSTDTCFDIGEQTTSSLLDYTFNHLAYRTRFKPYESGNGGIMRLAPIPMAFHNDTIEAGRVSVLSSRTTHASNECKDGALLFGEIIAVAMHARTKEDVVQYLAHMEPRLSTRKLKMIATGSFIGKARKNISSSGYVVTSLEAALWAFHETANFHDGLVAAVNLGDDADTVGAIYGQLAGAYYGADAIPRKWVDQLYASDMITELGYKIASRAGTFAVIEYEK